VARAAVEQARQLVHYKQDQEDAMNAKVDQQQAIPPQNEAEWNSSCFWLEVCYYISFEMV
jgi:hypothetical protein